MKIFVTGGAGFIGSHTVQALLEQGHEVSGCDDFSNSSIEAIRRVEQLTGARVDLHRVDLRDEASLVNLVDRVQPDAVIHLAGKKSVPESKSEPLTYYDNNLVGTLNLIKAMERVETRKLVFSSSATVYGSDSVCPVTESSNLSATNPYGRTKLFAEEILRDLSAADSSWSMGILRYFNPVGAHPSGMIGEDPRGAPNNLVPYVAQVATGLREHVTIFGDDYPTEDGTGLRDYIHILDLAEAHVDALEFVNENCGVHTWNLGTGVAHSVLEVLHEFEAVCGHSIPYVVSTRRPGDVAVSFADPSLAHRDLGWRAERGLREMLVDHWRWQMTNPTGYGTGVNTRGDAN